MRCCTCGSACAGNGRDGDGLVRIPGRVKEQAGYNFPIRAAIEYATTGRAGGYVRNGAPGYMRQGYRPHGLGKLFRSRS